MATQIFDDGSTLSTDLTEEGYRTTSTNADGQGFFDGGIFSSSNSKDASNPFSSSRSAGGSNLSGIFGGVFASTTAAINLFDLSSARRSAAGLMPGGASSQVSQGTSPSTNINSSATSAKARDWRVSISLADPKLFGLDQTSAIQSPLAGTGGVIFPYIPQISVQYNARYQSQQLTHSNYNSYFYEGSDVNAITITGDFTVQNIAEGQYLLAAIYFFRSATKMFFGKDTNAGNPPPMVKLNGYGQHYFPDVNCVITQFTHTMGPEVDYLEIPVPSSTPAPSTRTTPSSGGPGTVRLPTVSQITVIVQPVYSRKNIHDNFTLDKFSKGGLLSNGFL
jgi:hypothetical protein